MVQRAVKVRIYPNREQAGTIDRVLGCYRFVYNTMLSMKQQAYNERKERLTLCDLSKHFHGTLLKDERYSWLKEQNTKVMKQAIRQMLVAYDNFFKHGRNFPKFKKKSDCSSALFPIDAISKSNTFETKHITLTKSLKRLRFRCSDLQFGRLQRYREGIRSATISKTKSGRYFLSILVEMDEQEFKRFGRTGGRVGIDLGVKDFVITSDGEVFENRHFFTKSERKIARLHKQLSKKVKGSNNRRKARKRLAKAYEKQENQRRDYIHQIANSLLRENDYIFMEDLNVQGMLKNRCLSKAISELGFSTFKTILKDKAALNDKIVVEVSRWFPSSKTCHVCGYVYKDLTLKEREWTCPVCGTHHDRDLNAALNLLNEGERIIGLRKPEFTLADYPTMDDRPSDGVLKSSGRMKQEVESEKQPV